MVSKIRILEPIGTSTKCSGGIPPLAHNSKNFKYFVDISFAPEFSVPMTEQYLCQFSTLKRRGKPSPQNYRYLK